MGQTRLIAIGRVPDSDYHINGGMGQALIKGCQSGPMQGCQVR